MLFRAAAPGRGRSGADRCARRAVRLDHHDTLAYDDARRGIGRRVRVEAGRIDAVRLAGDIAAEPWLRELFDEQEAVTNLGAMLLAPVSAAPVRRPAADSCAAAGA